MDHSNRQWFFSDNQVEYLSEVIEFLEFAFRNNKDQSVLCPCSKCVNRFDRSKDEMFDHLVMNRTIKSYDVWYCHGKSLSTANSESVNVVLEDSISNAETCDGDDMMAILSDIFGIPTEVKPMNLEENETTQEVFGGELLNIPHPDVEIFIKLMQDIDKEMYPGCKKYNRLSFTLQLYNIKCRFGWVNKSFDVLIKLLKDLFHKGETLSSSFHES